MLAHATGGALDAVAVDALRETVAFPHRVHLGGDWYLNHADGPARPPARQPWDALHRAARRVGDRAGRRRTPPRTGAPARRSAHEEQGLGRLLRALTDPTGSPRRPAARRSPATSGSRPPQVLLARARRAAGRADARGQGRPQRRAPQPQRRRQRSSWPCDGVPVLVDPGRPTYTAQTFGPDRYDIWTMQSTWHNVPEIRGTAQAPGRRSPPGT